MARFVDIDRLMFADPPDPEAERLAARVELLKSHLSPATATWRSEHSDIVTEHLRHLAEMAARINIATLVKWADTTFALMAGIDERRVA